MIEPSPSSPLVLDSISPRRAPPGFPVPLFGKDYCGKLPACIAMDDTNEDTMSPRSDNICHLNKTFGGVDKMGVHEERDLLQNHYTDAISYNKNDGFHMELSNGLHYISGHGELKCRQVECLDPGVRLLGLPNNCGFHRQWRFPDQFRPCGPDCRGAFCHCL